MPTRMVTTVVAVASARSHVETTTERTVGGRVKQKREMMTGEPSKGRTNVKTAPITLMDGANA
jgi:hypothetical protein